jgi:hypothetical protein
MNTLSPELYVAQLDARFRLFTGAVDLLAMRAAIGETEFRKYITCARWARAARRAA